MGLFLLFGSYSLLAQVLLLREISQVFSAHELSLASALAFWLLWTAAGVKVGAAAAGDAAFRRWALVFAAAAPLNLLLARLAPGFLPQLSQPGLFGMLAGSALLCLPAAFANGCAAGAALRDRPAWFYAAEAAGAAAAGLFTIFYFRYFPGLEAAHALACPALAFCAAYPASPFSPRRATIGAAAATLLAAAAFAAPRAWTLKPPSPRPSAVVTTEGGRLARAGDAGALIYDDGRLAHSPEDTSAEELVHVALLGLKKPGKVLLHGGGAFFALPEALKHSPGAVEIAEPDRFKAEALADITGADAGTYALLRADPRALAGREGYYSAIIQAAGAPENAAQNRHYTLEFFRKAASMLEPGGVLVFQLPFAENYVPPQTAYAAACVLAAARAAFPHVEFFPGGKLTVLASAAPPNLDPAALAAAYARRGLKTRAVVPSTLPFILNPYRRAWAAAALEKPRDPPLNSDLNPLAYFRFWRAWLSMVLAPSALLGIAGLAAAGLYAAWRLKDALRFSPEERTGEAFLMGFWGLALETAALLVFQAGTGRLSPELGAMFALFMAGAAAGAWAARRAGPRLILAFEGAAAALSLAAALRPELAQAAWGARAVILAGGFLSGAFFSAAAGRTGPAVYSWDLAGGAAGGLAVAAFAAPMAGLRGAFYLSAAAAAAALLGGLAVNYSRPSSTASSVKV